MTHHPALLDRWCRIASEKRHQAGVNLTSRDLARVVSESGISLEVLVEHARGRGWLREVAA